MTSISITFNAVKARRAIPSSYHLNDNLVKANPTQMKLVDLFIFYTPVLIHNTIPWKNDAGEVGGVLSRDRL